MYDVEFYHRYEVELKFLSEIDKLNYYKFLVIPSIENFFIDSEYLTKGIQPLLQSIYIVKNNPKIDDFDRKILLFFNFEYEKNMVL